MKGAKRAAGLEELRKSRSITQTGVAEYLEINQGEVSRMERRTDIYISSPPGCWGRKVAKVAEKSIANSLRGRLFAS